MQYCSKCKVSVTGSKRCCPLCQSELRGEGKPEEEVYPKIPQPRYTKNFLLKLISFVSITSITVSIAINMLIPSEVMWSLFVSGGVLCAWITSMVGISYRKKLLQNITGQLYLITLFAIIWDYCAGWRNWSLDYVIPCGGAITLVSMFILAVLLKFPATDYLFYLVISCFYGIIPIVFMSVGILTVLYPSVICVACSLISSSAVLLFQGKKIKSVVYRKFHV